MLNEVRHMTTHTYMIKTTVIQFRNLRCCILFTFIYCLFLIWTLSL